MRSTVRVAALIAALSAALVACQQKRPEPVPGPQSQGAPHKAAPAQGPQSRLFRS
jgi:predicted small lipoprotein YifL